MTSNPIKNNNAANEKPSDKFIRWVYKVFEPINLFTLFLVIVVALQTCILRNQLTEMKTEQRPWVSIDPFIGGITWDEKGGHLALRFELKNNGRSIARHVTTRIELVPFMGQD